MPFFEWLLNAAVLLLHRLLVRLRREPSPVMVVVVATGDAPRIEPRRSSLVPGILLGAGIALVIVGLAMLFRRD